MDVSFSAEQSLQRVLSAEDFACISDARVCPDNEQVLCLQLLYEDGSRRVKYYAIEQVDARGMRWLSCNFQTRRGVYRLWLVEQPRQLQSTNQFDFCLFLLSADFSHRLLTLGNYDFSYCHFLQPVNFSYARVMQGWLDFSPCVFHAVVDFSCCRFSDTIYFGNCRFVAAVCFDDTEFQQACYVVDTTFQQPVSFRHSRFMQLTHFMTVQFSAEVDFRQAQFQQRCFFGEVRFTKGGQFMACRFEEIADFWQDAFNYPSDFSDCFFSKASFNECQFLGLSNFQDAQFLKLAQFDYTRFAGELDLQRAQFKCSVQFKQAEVQQLNARNLHCQSALDVSDAAIVSMDLSQAKMTQLRFSGLRLQEKLNLATYELFKQQAKNSINRQAFADIRARQGLLQQLLHYWPLRKI